MRRTKEESRKALLEAAGRLFARDGIASVKVSDIATESGIDACMINYHFGGREGLIEAVIDEALQRWEKIDMRQYYQDNKALLDDRSGQRVFISGLVESVFKTLGSENDDDPGKRMLLQLLQYPGELRPKIVDRHIKPIFSVFYEIYRKITGNSSSEDAFCWFLILICPQYVNTSSPGLFELIAPSGNLGPAFSRRLQLITVSVLLTGLGLD
jgi:AcrR family transcriptional regulator